MLVRHALRRTRSPAQLQSLFYALGEVSPAGKANSGSECCLIRSRSHSRLGDATASTSASPHPGTTSTRGFCDAAGERSAGVSGAASFPYGRAADMNGSAAGSSPGAAADSTAEPVEADEDDDTDARTEEARQRILEAALRHVVHPVACHPLVAHQSSLYRRAWLDSTPLQHPCCAPSRTSSRCLLKQPEVCQKLSKMSAEPRTARSVWTAAALQARETLCRLLLSGGAC